MLSFRSYLQGERRNVGVSVLLLFVMMSSHALLETARDTLFLTSLPASRLPGVYFAVALVSLAFATLQNRAHQALRKRNALTLSLMVCALGSLAFALVPHRGVFFYGFYVWVAVVATLCVGQFWLLMADQFFLSQAKRVYTVIGAGGLAGAAFGALLSGVIIKFLGPAALIFLGTGFLFGAALLSQGLGHTRGSESLTESPAPSFKEVFQHPYSRKIIALVFVATLTLTLIDILFRSYIATNVPKEKIGMLLATLYTGLNATAFVIQWFISGRLVRRLGTIRAIAIFPLLLTASLSFFGLSLTLIPLLIVKAIDGALRHSLHRTSLEILFVPVPASVRRATKSFSDSLGGRMGQATAALLALGFFSLGAFPAPGVWVAVASAVIWLAILFPLRSRYVELFRAQLREDVGETTGNVRDLDQASIETIVASLSHPEEDRVIHAIELLDHRGKTNLIPSFILYHPSDRIVKTALTVLSGTARTDFWKAAKYLVESADPAIQSLAISVYTRTAPVIDFEILKAATGSADLGVRASAFVALIQKKEVTVTESPKAAKWLVSGNELQRAAVLRAIREHRSTDFDDILGELSSIRGPRLGAELARLVRSRPEPKFISLLLPFLAYRFCRPQVREAFFEIGDAAYEFLAGALSDNNIPTAVRRHIPRTLSRFPARSTGRLLMTQLAEEQEPTVFYKLLRGLGRIVAEDPSLRLDARVLDRLLHRHVKRIEALRNWRGAIAEGESNEARVIKRSVAGLEQRHFEELFRLLGLRFPQEDFRRIYGSVLSLEERSRSSGLELLENVLRDPLRAEVLRICTTSNLVSPKPLGRLMVEIAGSEFPVLRELARDLQEPAREGVAHHAI